MKRNKKQVALGVSLLVMAIVIACIIGVIIMLYLSGDHVYEKIKDEYVTVPEEDDPHPMLSFDWDALKAQYPGIVAWIDMAPGISYPVMQGDDNSFYLNHGPDGERNYNGSIFMHYANTPDLSDRNTIIYGHNMKSGKMFAMLKKYTDEAFMEQNPYIDIYTEEGRYSYRIFECAYREDATDGYTPIYFNEYEAYSLMLQKTLATSGVRLSSPSENSHIVMLSTCGKHNTTQRLTVRGYFEEFRSYTDEIRDGDMQESVWEALQIREVQP